jgi:hypothetical protein
VCLLNPDLQPQTVLTRFNEAKLTVPHRGIVKLRRSAQTGVYENQRAQLSRIPISA